MERLNGEERFNVMEYGFYVSRQGFNTLLDTSTLHLYTAVKRTFS